MCVLAPQLRSTALASSRTIDDCGVFRPYRHTITLGILRARAWRLFIPVHEHWSYPYMGIIRTLISAFCVPHEREVEDVDERDDLGRARRLELRQLVLRVLTGYSQGTHKGTQEHLRQLALRRRRAGELSSGYSRGTRRVLTGHSQGTHGILTG